MIAGGRPNCVGDFQGLFSRKGMRKGCGAVPRAVHTSYYVDSANGCGRVGIRVSTCPGGPEEGGGLTVTLTVTVTVTVTVVAYDGVDGRGTGRDTGGVSGSKIWQG